MAAGGACLWRSQAALRPVMPLPTTAMRLPAQPLARLAGAAPSDWHILAMSAQRGANREVFPRMRCVGAVTGLALQSGIAASVGASARRKATPTFRLSPSWATTPATVSSKIVCARAGS